MALLPARVTVDARDDPALGRFWARTLGWEASATAAGVTTVAPAGHVLADPTAVGIEIVTVPDPGTGRSRMHLDLATTSAAHQTELVARLRQLGATPADVGQGDVPWTVLADPEGNVFCVLDPREIYRDTGPIAALVVNCADPRAMARFWGGTLDWPLREATDDFAALRPVAGGGPYLEFIRTPDAGGVRSRLRLDLAPRHGDHEAEVARLRALGATPDAVGQGDAGWTVLADPEGNRFRVRAAA